MNYFVIIERKGKIIHFFDYFLPGLIPDRIIEMMVVQFVQDELRLCDGCEGAYHCHVMQKIENRNAYRKLCPVLFHDAVKPEWKIEELV